MDLSANSPPQTINLTGISSGALNESQTILVTATSSNPSLIPNPVVTYSSPAASGTLAFTVATNLGGTALISVIVQDTGGTLNGGKDRITNTFTVNVQGLAAPRLRIAKAGPGKSVVAWPTTFTGFVLQSRSDLTGGAWADFALNPQIAGSEYVVTNTVAGHQFFRLAKGPNNGVPRLRIFAASVNKVGMAWSTNSPGYVLQSRGNATSGTWTDLNAPRAVLGNEFVVTNSVAGNQFFRLKQ